MAVRAVFFDLDGTLLPMDLDVFTRYYFKLVFEELAPLAMRPDEILSLFNGGIGAMMHNDGSKTNREAFWNDVFAHCDRRKAAAIEARMNAFYLDGFRKTAVTCHFDPRARIAVETAKKRGFATVLATNPVFPAVATEIRMGFVGLTPRDFCHVTAYENSRYCKPNPLYYREITDLLGLDPADCAMVGNDTCDDLAAATLGMPVFILTDHIINQNNVDISALPHGGFQDLIAWIRSL